MTSRQLLETFLAPIRICQNYRPAFGKAQEGVTLADFRLLYGGDEFYSWIGLDSPLVYAAHKAAGGLTSIYRQIGVGAERLLREVVKDRLGLSSDEVAWQYEYQKGRTKKAVHMLDARISLADLREADRKRIGKWISETCRTSPGVRKSTPLDGVVFEIRQGYKSADSKRQNADLRFGLRAYQAGLLPVVAVLSSQVSETVIQRYRSDGMLVMTGIRSDDTSVSTFAFFREIVGFDLEEFFKTHSSAIQTVVHGLISDLLSSDK